MIKRAVTNTQFSSVGCGPTYGLPFTAGGAGGGGAITSDESCARRGTSVQYIRLAAFSSHLVLPSFAFLQTCVVLPHVLLALQAQPPFAAYEMHSRLRQGSCACNRFVQGRHPCEKPYLQYIHDWWCTTVTLARQRAKERKRSEFIDTMQPFC